MKFVCLNADDLGHPIPCARCGQTHRYVTRGCVPIAADEAFPGDVELLLTRGVCVPAPDGVETTSVFADANKHVRSTRDQTAAQMIRDELARQPEQLLTPEMRRFLRLKEPAAQ